MHIQVILLTIFISSVLAANSSAYFITTIPTTFESATVVLSTTNPTVSGNYSSISTTITYLNTYSSTPMFGFGYGFINSNILTTLVSTEMIMDLSITSANSGSQVILANFTTSTVSQLSINYVACASSFFLDVRTYYADLTSYAVYSVSNSSARTALISVPYKSKSNSSNAVVVYNTIGLSMIRVSTHTFEYTLSATAYGSSVFSLLVTVMPFNRMRFIRLCIYNYEAIVTVISPPFYFDSGFVTLLGGTITDNSALNFAITGTIFLGMTDWALTDANSVLDYNMTRSALTYSLISNSISRTTTGYIWYRQQACPAYTFNLNHVCVPCDYSCLTCQDITTSGCITCPSTRSLSAGSCLCISGYIDVNATLCQQLTCDATCKTCSYINQCGSCDINYNRILNGTECICANYTLDMYASIGNILCFPCHVSCFTCSSFSSSTSCLTCSLTKDRRSYLASNNTCNCINGYFNNPLVSVCPQCQYSCATCTNASICSTCNSTNSRSFNASTNLCSCQSGSYDDLLTQPCRTCPISCSSCTSLTNCLTCPSTRTLSSGACVCNVGFYQDNVNAQCPACLYSCYTCTNSTLCTQCSSTVFRIMSNNSCICQTGYYDVFGTQQCSACDPTCYTCSNSSYSGCVTCDTAKNRQKTANNTCVCANGYFQTDPTNATCNICYYSCLTCSNSPACISCDGSKHRTLNGTSCLCANSYYDDGGNMLCASCLYKCLTCTNNSICLTCDGGTRDVSNLTLCSCLTGFYDNGVSSSCLACLTTCLTCTNGNNCSTCPNTRTITSLQTCICVAKTFEPYCNACSFQCMSCVTTALTCTSCNGTALRYLNVSTSTCACYAGYFSDGINELCLTCQYSCATCSSSASCLTCPSNRVLNGSYCSCVNQFFENQLNLNCQACHYSCQICSAFSVCSACDSTYFRITSNISTLCTCKPSYYDNGVNQLCIACYSSCLTCSAFATCLSCNATLNRLLNGTSCLCNNNFYEDSTSKLCVACHFSCYLCISGTSCSTCQPNRTLDAVSSLCLCNSGLYNDATSNTCMSCAYPCINCLNSSSNCTSCDSTRTLSTVSNKCICLAGTYDSGLSCLTCQSTCATCSNGTSCLTCALGSLRNLNVTSQCICGAGYHDQNGTVIICVLCQYSCVTCSNNASCSSCFSGRIADVNGFCSCPTTLVYDNGVNPQCIACSYKCLSCSTISTNCTSCSSNNFRTLLNTSCICNTGYYDDGTNSICQICQYSCLSCSSATTCTACNTTNLRLYSSGPFCSCQSGYFDISNIQLCSTCSYQCLTCISSTNSCLSCVSSRTLVSVSSTCACKTGLYDSGAVNCSSCFYQCSTCSDGVTCLTCPLTRIKTTSSSCDCLTGYYDVNATLECQLCSGQCLQCSNFQVCTLCDSTTFRQLVNGSCICPSGYYSDASNLTNYVCLTCQYSCLTCISSTQCTSCNSLAFRVYNTTSHLCTCSDGYYDDTINTQCLLCPFDCLTCSSGVVCLTCQPQRNLVSNRCPCISSYYTDGTACALCPIECSTCANASYCTACMGSRTLVNNSCICSGGQFMLSGTSSCPTCQYTCATCVSLLKCSTCNSTLRRFLSGSFCMCSTGYYDDLINQPCVACQYSCMMCSSGTACLSCDSTLNRVLNTSTQLCDCSSGFYENSTTKVCTPCSYSCLTCSSNTACLSCNPTYSRTLNTTTNQCNCPSIGYFDNSVNPVCLVCDFTCYTCSAATTCTSCLNTTFRTLQVTNCTCANAYYEITGQPVCLACSYKCMSCFGLSTNCTSCSLTNFRSGLASCSCLTGTYDDGFNSLCKVCDYRCVNCTNGLTCLSCNSSNFRTLNVISTMCDCMVSYYDINNSTVCSSCHHSCSTCNQPTTCLTCPTTRQFYLGTCNCLPQTYDDATSLNCIPCHYTCFSCTNATNCLLCDSNAFRQINSTTLLCSCLLTYYDAANNTALCLKCDNSCATCLNGVSCSTCPGGVNKVINSTAGSNFCICMYAFYQNITGGALFGTNSICTACLFSCETCSVQNYLCLTCNSNSFRYLTAQKQCLCNTYYFEISGQKTCQRCFGNCLTCSGTSANECLTCDSTSFYLNSSCYSTCPSYYKQNITTRVCDLCTAFCLTCAVSSTLCTQCQPTYFLFQFNTSNILCIQNCPSHYYQINQTCYPCVSPCNLCTAAYVCVDCIAKYYLNVRCFPCESTCLSCTGPTVLDCSSCITNYHLSGGICKKLSCLSYQYVDSSLGCINCTTSYANSVSCTATTILSCKSSFLLQNSSCQSCSAVKGYTLDTTTSTCIDLCGDGIIISDLCDDGNLLNGDGCSSICTIENGWSCPNNSCQLKTLPILSLESISKVPKSNTVVIYVLFSTGVRLIKQNFIVTFTKIKNYNYEVVSTNSSFTRYLITINYLETAANDQLSLTVKSPISRLLIPAEEDAVSVVSAAIAISISLNLSIDVPILTSPPAIYISDSTTATYTQPLLYVILALHILTLITVLIVFILRLKVMLHVIDAFNAISLLYILCGPGLQNVIYLTSQSVVALQPFAYQFGSQLVDQTSPFFSFNYTQLIFSSCIIQLAIIIICILLRFVNQSNLNTWEYFRVSFIFAFSYDLLLSCFSIFFWTTYNTYQASYSWAASILIIILISYDALMYFWTVRNLTNRHKKVVPAVSFITNDLEGKDKGSHEPNNIFDFEKDEQDGRSKKALEYTISQNKTQMAEEEESSMSEVDYFDIRPSQESNFTVLGISHIGSYHLLMRNLLFPFAICVVVNLQQTTLRTSLFLAITILMILQLILGRAQSLRSIRNIKLFVMNLIYLLIGILEVTASVQQQTIDLVKIDAALISLVVIALVANFIFFIVSVKYSQSFKEYLIQKRNQEIVDKNNKLAEPHQKSYLKAQSKSNIKNILPIQKNAVSQQALYEDSQSRVEIQEKQLKFNQPINKYIDKSRMNNNSKLKNARHERDGTTFINIDDQISDYERKQMKIDLTNQKDEVYYTNSPSKMQRKIIGQKKYQSPNRIRFIQNQSDLDLSSFQIDHHQKDKPQKLKPKEIQEDYIVMNKAEERRKKKKVQKRQIEKLEISDDLPSETFQLHSKHDEIKKSGEIQEILEEMNDLPKGFQIEQEKSLIEKPATSKKRGLSIDEISSIREEREQFIEQGIGDESSEGMTVFKKILQDYKIYNHKKVDKKVSKKQNKK